MHGRRWFVGGVALPWVLARTIGSICVGALVAGSGPAQGFGGGVSGNSGKLPGMSCNDCHSGGASPSIKLSGPSVLDLGATGPYELDIITAASNHCAGFDVATTRGALGVVNQSVESQLKSGELTHTAYWPTGKTIQVRFTLQAPADPGSLTLYAAALDSDCTDSTSGDAAATATLDVAIGSAAGAASPSPAGPRGGCSSTGAEAGLGIVAMLTAALLVRRKH
jgi:uncharacterized protein (TIGR03382 family)